MKLNAVILAVLFNIIDFSNGENCTILKYNLAASTSSFTSCSIIYARPILFCEKCVDQYIAVLNDYQNLITLKDEDGPCINDLIHLDTLEIVETLYDNSVGLWEKGKCSECFTPDNGTLTNKLSEDTVRFNNLFANLNLCIDRKDVNSSNVCTVCVDKYNELDTFYRNMSKRNERNVCMDIVDWINGTRLFWSSNCCKFRHKDETVFIVSTILVISSTFLFYLLTKLCSQQKPPVLLKQTRFSGSFAQVSTG